MSNSLSRKLLCKELRNWPDIVKYDFCFNGNKNNKNKNGQVGL